MNINKYPSIENNKKGDLLIFLKIHKIRITVKTGSTLTLALIADENEWPTYSKVVINLNI